MLTRTFFARAPLAPGRFAPLPAGVGADFRALYGAYGLQLLPHRDGVEGFFIARLRRVK